MKKFSVGIIGGGPGGYVTAIRLNQYNINVVVFEKERLGGVCLNHGCIPTKSLVKVAELYSEIGNANKFGINITESKLDFSAVVNRKDAIVEQLVSGIEFIYKKRKIPIIKEEIIKLEKSENGYKLKSSENEYLLDYVS